MGGITYGLLRNFVTCRPTYRHLLLVSSNQGVLGWAEQEEDEKHIQSFVRKIKGKGIFLRHIFR